MSCYLCHNIPGLCMNKRETGHSHQPTGSYNLWVVSLPTGGGCVTGEVSSRAGLHPPHHACIALCAVPGLGCNHQGSDSSVWESCGPMGWCNLTPNAKWNKSWFIVWRLWDPGLLRRALRWLCSPGHCSVAKLKEKFLLWRSSYKTLAIQELLRHVVTSSWISHLKPPTFLERCAVGLLLYHAYKDTT